MALQERKLTSTLFQVWGQIRGFEGPILGLITGVLIIGVLNTGMQLIGLQDYHRLVVKRVILLAAVGFDTYQKNGKVKEIEASVIMGLPS